MPDPNAKPQPKSRVSVDAGGRILLPKKVRQRLGLAAGNELDVELEVLQLFRFCGKTPAGAILSKLEPLILRRLDRAGSCGSGIFTLEPNLCNTSPAPGWRRQKTGACWRTQTARDRPQDPIGQNPSQERGAA